MAVAFCVSLLGEELHPSGNICLRFVFSSEYVLCGYPGISSENFGYAYCVYIYGISSQYIVLESISIYVAYDAIAIPYFLFPVFGP